MSSTVVITGESICGGNVDGDALRDVGTNDVFLRGFNTVSGTDPSDGALNVDGTGQIVSAVCGLVEVTDRVVSVKGQAARYLAEIGDIIVGRITEVAGNKWLVDIGSPQSGIMLLSNVTEPGGMLRRRERGDELSMRQLFDQADLVVAEVQRISPDGVVSLHTRAADKYGKLTSFGRLVSVNPSLIKRSKHQFVSFPQYQSQVVIGINGNIWVTWMKNARTDKDPSSKEVVGHTEVSEDADGDLSNEIRQNIARVANCLTTLNHAGVQIFPRTIEAAVEATLSAGWSSFDILLPGNMEALVAKVQEAVGVKRARTA